MNKDEINLKIKELNEKQTDISIEVDKLERQKSAIEAVEVIKVLPLFDYDFDVCGLKMFEKRAKTLIVLMSCIRN